MLKINVVAVGKVKEKYFSDGIEEYAKRLKKYCVFSITKVTEENYFKPTDAEIFKIKETEADRIIPKLKGKVYSLSIEGKKVSSESFADLIKKAADGGEKLTFVVGGSHGLSDRVKKLSAPISFGDITLPHTLFRLVLTEQIYRAFTIINGTPYHK